MQQGTFSSGARRAVVRMLLPAAQKLTKDAEGKIKAAAPVESGELRNSIGSKVEASGNEIRMHWWASAPHAKYVEFGTIHMPAQSYMRRETLPMANMATLSSKLRKHGDSQRGLAFGE
jgi:HK97 gp10 family phage protein